MVDPEILKLPPVVRDAARVILLDSRERILLFGSIGEYENGATELWVPPGGGIEPGESFEAAALRELAEETGLTGVALGPCLWLRTWIGPMFGTMIEARERYFLCRVEAHEIPAGHVNPDAIEAAWAVTHRWWSLEEIAAAASAALFVPRRLLELLPPVLRGELPAEPLFIEHSDRWRGDLT